MLFFSDVDAKDISETYDSAYQYATEILTEYYEAIDQYKEEDFSDNISSAGLLQYMKKKIEAKRYKLDVYGKDDMQNYRLSFNLLNIENIGDHIKLTGYIAVSGSSTTLEAIVTGRTSGSSYNKNQRQSTIYAGQNRRIIKMSGYYK